MLREKIWNYITEYKLISEGETILVGFSGGADSVCLLLLLNELGKEKGFAIHAVHVNHCLRGEESDKDQLFAEEFCRERNIPISCYSCEVEKIAKERQIGIEEAGREERNRIFLACMEETGASRTALAHHKNDQAETVLFRLARGSSLAGLSGIRPLQGKMIHPLLFAEKKEILSELTERGIAWRMDSSNLTDHYARNRIRHQLVTVLEEQVNEKSISHIAEAAEDLAEAEAFLKELANPIRERCVSQDGAMVRVREELLKEPGILQRYVLMDALSLAAGGRRNLGREQIRQLKDLLTGDTGRRISLPGNLVAIRSYGEILLISAAADTEELPAEVAFEGPGCYVFGNTVFRCEILSEVPGEIPEKTYTKWLDYDKIKCGLGFRTRKPGDFLVTTENGGRKKLKSYLIDEKVPAGQRDRIPLLCAGSRVFWVVGYRISEDCKITEHTERILKITVSEDRT